MSTAIEKINNFKNDKKKVISKLADINANNKKQLNINALQSNTHDFQQQDLSIHCL